MEKKKAGEDALNTSDVSKYILNLSYCNYTKKFKTNQVAVIKKSYNDNYFANLIFYLLTYSINLMYFALTW